MFLNIFYIISFLTIFLKKIMKDIIKKYILAWFAFSLTVIFVSITYWAFINILEVNSWETLTSTLMNDIINNQKDLDTRMSLLSWNTWNVTWWCSYWVSWWTATNCWLSQWITCSSGNTARIITFHSPGWVWQWNWSSTYASWFCISQ